MKKKKKLNLKIEKINVLDVNDSSEVFGGAKDTKNQEHTCPTFTTNNDTCVTCIVDSYCGCDR